MGDQQVMFLIRTAFWLAIVVLLLPTDAQQQAKLKTTAANAVTYASTYCDRNPATCDQGAQYWALFRRKLDFGAQLALDLAKDHFLPGTGETSRPVKFEQPERGLRPSDLDPTWRGRRHADPRA